MSQAYRAEEQASSGQSQVAHRKHGSRRKPPTPEAESNHSGLPTADIPSRGSKNHADGRCRPCRFHYTPQGCRDGPLCNFCHHEHSQAKLMDAWAWSARRAALVNDQGRRASDTSGPTLSFPQGNEPWMASDIRGSASSPLSDSQSPGHMSSSSQRAPDNSGSSALLLFGRNSHGHTGNGISASSDSPSPQRLGLNGRRFHRQASNESSRPLRTVDSLQSFPQGISSSEQNVGPNGENRMPYLEIVLMQHMVYASMEQAQHNVHPKIREWADFIMESTPQDLFSLVNESNPDHYVE